MVRLEPPVVARQRPAAAASAARSSRSAAGSSSASRPTSASTERFATACTCRRRPTLLRAVLETPPAPRARVLAGYAGWGPGQLDDELAQSAWLIGDVDLDLVFDVDAAVDVGNRDPPPRRRSVGAPDEPRRALTSAPKLRSELRELTA